MTRRGWIGLSVLLVLGVIGGGLTLWHRPSRGPTVVSPGDTRAVVARFEKQTSPSATLDLQALFGREGARALLDPAEALPQWTRYPYADAAALERYTKTCRVADTPHLSGALAKALAWQSFACGHAPEPDDHFFKDPPYMHPSGASFASLAMPSKGGAWGREHAALFHVTELSLLGLREPSLNLLGELSRTGLREIARGDDIVLSDNWLLLREESDGTRNEVVRAYPRWRWEAEARGSDLRLGAYSEGTPCALRASPDLCWNARSPSPLRAALVGATLALSLAALAALVWRVQTARLRELDRALILRTLTHELRTPATSLALDLEPLRDAYDDIPGALQESLLRACDDAERIKRVLAVTSRWLSLQETAGKWIAVERVPLAMPLVESVVEGYGEDVVVTGPREDRPLSTDPSWLRIAIKNLIDNALAHGRAPVQVVVRWQRDKLWIEVIDHGDTTGVSLAELTTAFRKGTSSTGLGLGLAIVARVATALGGGLEHEAHPTTFRLVVADLAEPT